MADDAGGAGAGAGTGAGTGATGASDATDAVSATDAAATAAATGIKARAVPDSYPALVPRCWKLSFMPHSGIVGSYGGGAAMETANQVCLLRLDPARIPGALKPRVVAAVGDALDTAAAVPAAERTMDPSPDGFRPKAAEDLSWELALHISGRVVDADYLNLMHQGWLFHEVPDEEGALGRGLFPLVGLFDAVHLRADDGAGPQAAIGVDALSPADQHVHLVDDGAWHVGSDMARFALEAGVNQFAKAWAVCVDLSTRCVEVQLLLIAPPIAEDALERAVRAATDGLEAGKLAEGLMTGEGPLAALKPFEDDLKAVLIGKA